MPAPDEEEVYLIWFALDHQQVLPLVAAAGVDPGPPGPLLGKVGQVEVVDIEGRHTAPAAGQGEADLDDLVPGIEIAPLGGGGADLPACPRSAASEPAHRTTAADKPLLS